MDLSREQKKALEEKYKQQRRAMWAGKRASGETNADLLQEKEKISETLEGSEHISARHEKQSPETDSIVRDRDSVTEEASNDSCRELVTTPLPKRSAAREELSSSESAETKERANGSLASRIEEDEICDGVQEQHEDSTKSGLLQSSQRGHEDSKCVTEVLDSFGFMSQQKTPGPLTWKLRLGVLGVILILVSIGILLGYLFAS